jgi:hypothetical protein
MDQVVYVLLRKDLPSLNPGKAAAQVHHAGVQMMAKYGHYETMQSYKQQADGFGTTIVLGSTLYGINSMLDFTSESIWLRGRVLDPSYPFIVPNMEIADLIPQNQDTKIVKTYEDGRVLMVRPETTCAWFYGDKDDIGFTSLFKNFELYP